MTDSEYVTNGTWLHPTGRADAIDEVADHFERRRGATAFWTAGADVEWPSRARARRSAPVLHRHEGARLAG